MWAAIFIIIAEKSNGTVLFAICTVGSFGFFPRFWYRSHLVNSRKRYACSLWKIGKCSSSTEHNRLFFDICCVPLDPRNLFDFHLLDGWKAAALRSSWGPLCSRVVTQLSLIQKLSGFGRTSEYPESINQFCAGRILNVGVLWWPLQYYSFPFCLVVKAFCSVHH